MLDWIDRLAGWWIAWRTARLVVGDLGEFKADGHGWQMIADAPGIAILADQAAALLEGQGAENYVQFDMMPRLDRGKLPVRVTVQWASGESPASKAARLEAALADGLRCWQIRRL